MNKDINSLLEESIYSDKGPYVIEPTSSNNNIIKWLETNKNHFETQLSTYGTVLLRGFNLEKHNSFESIINIICEEVIIGYGDLPEEKGSKKIYGSTPYPEDMKILYHNESSHLSTWPTRQFFACVIPAEIGGETPIVDCRKIYQTMDVSLRKDLEEKGLLYIRNFIPGLDVSWQDFYKTHNKKEVEDKIISSGGDFEWMPDGVLFTKRHAHAIHKHPISNEKVFFNQIMLHHPYFLKAEVRNVLMSLCGEDNMPRTVKFGDGTPINNNSLQHLLDLYDQESVAFKWQKGDLLICDNMLVAHARNSFEGERKIIVGLGNPNGV